MGKRVVVYRLWPGDRYDTISITVPDEPWDEEVVEARAVTKAWEMLYFNRMKPLQIGLMMNSFQKPQEATPCGHKLAHMALLGEAGDGRYLIVCENCSDVWWTKEGYARVIPKAKLKTPKTD